MGRYRDRPSSIWGLSDVLLTLSSDHVPRSKMLHAKHTKLYEDLSIQVDDIYLLTMIKKWSLKS